MHEIEQGWGVIEVLVLHDGGLEGVGLERALGDEPDMRVRVAASVAEAVRLVREEAPDVVVTDARRAGADELGPLTVEGAARWVAQVRTHEDDRIGEVLLAGACGLFSDRTASAGLVDAVRQVAAGRGWLAPDLVPWLVRDYVPYHRRRSAARRRLGALGSGQMRLLALVAQGRTNAEIAAELHLAVSTTKEYVGALLGQLGVTRSQAIALAVLADLATFPDPAALPGGGRRR